jgi:hypothetical protein
VVSQVNSNFGTSTVKNGNRVLEFAVKFFLLNGSKITTTEILCRYAQALFRLVEFTSAVSQQRTLIASVALAEALECSQGYNSHHV